MKKVKVLVFILIILLLLLATIIFQDRELLGTNWSEADYRDFILEKIYGTAEYTFDNGTRVDILTESHAIEIEYAYNWYEAVGQSLYYSELSGKKPGIILILAKRKEYKKYIDRTLLLSNKYGITVWTISENGSLRCIN